MSRGAVASDWHWGNGVLLSLHITALCRLTYVLLACPLFRHVRPRGCIPGITVVMCWLTAGFVVNKYSKDTPAQEYGIL